MMYGDLTEYSALDKAMDTNLGFFQMHGKQN